MRYVIVCLIKEEALEFHEKLASEVSYKFKISRQKLPAHFTLKAPFETDDIKFLVKKLETFTLFIEKKPLEIAGFDHFKDAIIFMNVKLSPEGVKIYDDLILNLKQIPTLEWRKNDGEIGYKKPFHCTVATHLNSINFYSIWDYVLNYKVDFHGYFDNISILQWNGARWVTYREFNFL